MWVGKLEAAMAIITNKPASSQLISPILVLLSVLFILSIINGRECAQLMSRHVQFLKTNYGNGGRHVGCARNASVCSDPVKNPNGGSTCCFNTFCKDLASDFLHCGQCGFPCPYGLACCSGFCVDIKNDPMHCGCCFYQCPKHEKCIYGLCGY